MALTGENMVRVISVTSGKGGVGKTNSTVNIAVALARQGKRVLLLDADLGLGNLDVLLGLAPKYNIDHLLKGEKTFEEVLVDGPGGIKILPASSGIHELTELSAESRLALTAQIENYSDKVDVMLIDTGAGISSNVLFFNVAAQEIVVVVTPEPTSLTDAYALMKVLSTKHGEKHFRLISNTVKSPEDGVEVYRKISLAADRFLNISVDYLGHVLYDDSVHKAVVNQKAVIELYPHTKASKCYESVAKKIAMLPPPKNPKGGMQFFWRQMLDGDTQPL